MKQNPKDHKRLGEALDLFAFDEDIGKGLPLWLPHGTVLRDELEKLMKELEFEAGFQRVATPHLARRELYLRTGHLPYYEDGMFPAMRAGGEQALYLRPMNCPHHHKVFAARKRSHRELPLRLAEYGQVYRYEDSGAVSGLLRTRAMCMNDAHIYCSKEQVADECAAVLEMHRRVYGVLGLKDWRVRLSLHDDGPKGVEKFVEDPEGWPHAEQLLREVLVRSGLPFYEGRGEAAFYGPKVDFQFRMVTGREETASTLQLDFAMARRLGLSYAGPDGLAHAPFILHRAPLGTHERFVALLLEHFGGAFPTWLAPVQARVIPVSAELQGYGKQVVDALRRQWIRAELDAGEEPLNRKIRQGVARKIPNLLIVGPREAAAQAVTLRRLGHALQETLPLAQLVEQLTERIRSRA